MRNRRVVGSEVEVGVWGLGAGGFALGGCGLGIGKRKALDMWQLGVGKSMGVGSRQWGFGDCIFEIRDKYLGR